MRPGSFTFCATGGVMARPSAEAASASNPAPASSAAMAATAGPGSVSPAKPGRSKCRRRSCAGRSQGRFQPWPAIAAVGSWRLATACRVRPVISDGAAGWWRAGAHGGGPRHARWRWMGVAARGRCGRDSGGGCGCGWRWISCGRAGLPALGSLGAAIGRVVLGHARHRCMLVPRRQNLSRHSDAARH